MAIPTSANYVFLPWVQQGLLAGLTSGARWEAVPLFELVH
jgi:hypothetical protein